MTQLSFGLGRRFCAERSCYDRGLSHVPVPFVADEWSRTVAIVCRQKAVDLGDVHPTQQVRIVGRVRPSVGRGTHDALVHTVHHIDGSLRFGSWPECGGGQKVRCALQAPPRIVPIVGVRSDAGHSKWVQRLEQQRPHATDEHRRVTVHTADGGVVVEPARFVCVEQFSSALWRIRPNDQCADLITEPGSCVDRHAAMVPRHGDYAHDVPENSERDTPASVTPDDMSDLDRRLPRWVLPAIALFWLGFLATIMARHTFNRLTSLLILLLVSLFLALAIEPGVNYLAGRGWRRGRATMTILIGVLIAFLVFVVAIGTLVGQQLSELVSQSDAYITDTVQWLNDTFGTNIDPQEVIDEVNDPNGRVQEFVLSQGDDAVRLSLTAVGVIFQGLSVILFTYYMVADGPRLRRVICSRLTPDRQVRVLNAWELAINKTGGYLYSRALLALLSAFFHWVCFEAIGIQAPIALALWVGLVSQFLPVVGTYLAGILPVLITFLDSPLKALIVIGFIVVYQQIENYLFAPRITARTMELHPAIAFGAALGGAALLGPIGAILALPGAAMIQALAGEAGRRYEVIDNDLTTIRQPRRARRAKETGGDAGPS